MKKSEKNNIKYRFNARRIALKKGYRSGLEEMIATLLRIHNIKALYEDKEHKIKFVQPAVNRSYLPDFVLPNGIIIETKGRFTMADRTKHLLIKEQYGDKYDIRFIFSNENAKLYKGSPTTYGEWCKKHGFIYATKCIPTEWLKGAKT